MDDWLAVSTEGFASMNAGREPAHLVKELVQNALDALGDGGGQILLTAERLPGGLHIAWSDLAEVKSLAVSEEHRRQGLGEALVKACLEEAGRLRIPNIFALTYVKAFFEKCGFVEEDKSTLPHKIWGECYRCPKFPDCDESALIYRIKQP